MRVSIGRLPWCASSHGRLRVGNHASCTRVTFPQTHDRQRMTESFQRFQVRREMLLFFLPVRRSGVHSSVNTPHRPQSNIWLLGKTFLHVSRVNRQSYVTASPPDSVCAFDYFTSAKVALTLTHIWMIVLSSPKHHLSQN